MLISVVVCFLGGYTATAFSSESAKSWGNVFLNSNMLNLTINLSNKCIRRKNNGLKISTLAHNLQSSGIGAVIISQSIVTQKSEPTTVGIRIIPYIITKKTGSLRILIPEVPELGNLRKFYPACTYRDNFISSQYMKYYPLVFLKVDNKTQRDAVTKYLKTMIIFSENKFILFDNELINAKASNVRELLNKVLGKKQAPFLNGLPFNVCVELIDEKRTPVKFLVKNRGDSNPCSSEGNVSEPDNQLKTTTPNRTEKSKLEASTKNVYSPPPAKQREDNNQQCVGDQTIAQLKEQIAQLMQEKFEIEISRDFHKMKRDEADEQMAKLKQEKFEIEISRDFYKMKRDEADEQIEKLKEENKGLRSQIQTNPEIQKLERQVAQLKKERDEAAKLAKSSSNRKPAGSHRLIVVSLSKNYSITQQRAIQNSLFEALSKVKGTETPLTLVTIGSGRQHNTILTSAKLQKLPVSGRRISILGKIESGVRFGARDLWAIGDLGKEVDTFIQQKEKSADAIGHVLYLTDNTRLPEKPPNKERGVPLAWREDGIALTVLTTKTCQVWEKSVRATCVSWQTRSELEKELNTFLQ